MILTPDYLLSNGFIEADVLVVPGDDVRAFVKILPYEGSITVYIRSEIIKGISSGVRYMSDNGTIYLIKTIDTDEINKELSDIKAKFRF